LLARERLMVLQNELRRIQGILNKPAKPSKCGRVYFDINSVTVYLNRNFCTKTQSYAFVVLFKCEKQVEATQMATLMCTSVLRISEVHFNDHIRFENILDSSSILLEVYAMRFNDYSCKVLKNKAKSLLSPSKRNTMKDSCDMLEFTFCGHAFINCRISGNRKFYLDGTVYPLEGTVDVRIYCTSLPPNIKIDFRGFLTMYQIISGLASWTRYWAVLLYILLHFFTFLILVICNTFRILLSADSKDLCNAWIRAINETLDIMRG
uniref:Anillin domain-containing protein n=1 Tax=Dracunculus medinensis TaxID=318479 RepID=A0A0N4U359_DRAME